MIHVKIKMSCNDRTEVFPQGDVYEVPGVGTVVVLSQKEVNHIFEWGFRWPKYTDWAVNEHAITHYHRTESGGVVFTLGAPTNVILPQEVRDALGMNVTKAIAGIDYIGTSVSFCCFNEKRELLINQRSDQCRDEHFKWGCGAGQLEFGEKEDEAVVREVREEYGCEKVVILDQMLSVSTFRIQAGRPSHWLNTPYAISVLKDEVRIKEPHKMLKIDWITQRDFRRMKEEGTLGECALRSIGHNWHIVAEYWLER